MDPGTRPQLGLEEFGDALANILLSLSKDDAAKPSSAATAPVNAAQSADQRAGLSLLVARASRPTAIQPPAVKGEPPDPAVLGAELLQNAARALELQAAQEPAARAPTPDARAPAAQRDAALAAPALSNSELQELCELLFSITMELHATLSEEAGSVLQELLQGVQAVKRLLRLQSSLPSSAVCTVQPALRVWYARVKHLSLGVVFNESQGSDLSLLHLYAKLMTSEVVAALRRTEHEAEP